MPISSDNIFSHDFKDRPFWWDRSPLDNPHPVPLPKNVDVLIIGSGYTGLCTALQTARGGKSTLVIDANEPGWGCSSRNGGQISTGIKPDFEALAKNHGSHAAFEAHREGLRAIASIGNFIQEEGIECDYRVCGRFYGAHSPRHFEKLKRKINAQQKGLEIDAQLVQRKDQGEEIGSDFYHGGIVQTQFASVDPAAYHQGILGKVREAGARVEGLTEALAVSKRSKGAGFDVQTSRGLVRAGDVVVATNGYTSRLTPWLHRRVFSIGSYMIATEDLGGDVARSLIPRDRMVVDSRRIVVYFRLSPDGRRIIFGGRVSLNETNPRVSAPRLHRHMTAIFPQLRTAKISHSWMGFVGWTFQHMPHIGRHDGIWYSMGYCGSGVALSTYFGTRLGQQIMGQEAGRTVLSDLPFRTRPGYYGNPWFLSASVGWYGFLDRLGI
ncbi:MAG: FAD-binding oxidoreductase [Proteobacteria bacterium]|nr:FAD-binding oxidoreductase [Pseudomonadota bacterium]